MIVDRRYYTAVDDWKLLLKNRSRQTDRMLAAHELINNNCIPGNHMHSTVGIPIARAGRSIVHQLRRYFDRTCMLRPIEDNLTHIM